MSHKRPSCNSSCSKCWRSVNSGSGQEKLSEGLSGLGGRRRHALPVYDSSLPAAFDFHWYVRDIFCTTMYSMSHSHYIQRGWVKLVDDGVNGSQSGSLLKRNREETR